LVGPAERGGFIQQDLAEPCKHWPDCTIAEHCPAVEKA
jgi:hypothetical protein